jgi:hypothetical protein
VASAPVRPLGDALAAAGLGSSDLVGGDAALGTRPAAVERAFSVPVPGRPGWTLDGRYDVVEEDGTVRGVKTASPRGVRYRTEEAAGFSGEKGLQATSYAWARREETGRIPPVVAFDVVVKPE